MLLAALLPAALLPAAVPLAAVLLVAGPAEADACAERAARLCPLAPVCKVEDFLT